MSAATITCASCRREFAATALFCPNCGTPKVAGAADPLIGKLLGERFLVQERIGQGGSGMIYRAEHVTLRRKVAIKVLHHELSRDDLAIERFRREATMVAEIDNDHIVEIHDFGKTQDGRLYLAMELLEGETLDAVLARDGKLAVDRVADILIQTGDGLVEAHAIGYVHRDLRPRNIYLSARRGKANFVKILDFGLAKIVESEAGAASTSLGMTFGDPKYMSPEQARGDRIDRRADIYQLGCVAYEMLTGAPPFAGARVFDVLSKHVSEAPRAVGLARPDTPKWLEAVVMRALAKRPEERFATVSRMVEALRTGMQTGAVMAEEVARTKEAELPASVSRVMEKLQIERAAIEDDDVVELAPKAAVVAAPVAQAAGAAGAAASSAPSASSASERRRTGTPAVGVPVSDAVPAAVALKEPEEDLRKTVERKPTGGSARGKHSDAHRAHDSAGISQAWFKDGDRLDGGGALEESQAIKLERARGTISPAATGVIDEYEDRPRPVWKVLAAIALALAVAGAAVLIVSRGKGSGGGSASASGSASSSGSSAASASASGSSVASGSQVAMVTPDAAVAVAEAGSGTGSGAGSTVSSGSGASGGSGSGSGSAKGSGSGSGSGSAKGGGGKIDRTHAGSGSAHGSGSASDTDLGVPLMSDGSGSGTGAADAESARKADFYAKMGQQSLASGDAVGAAGNFKKALDLDGKNVDAIIGLGQIAIQQGLYSEAVAHLKRAAKLAPKNAQVQELLGEAYLNSGNAKAAADAFKHALQLDPDNARARDGYNEAANRLPPPTDDE